MKSNKQKLSNKEYTENLKQYLDSSCVDNLTIVDLNNVLEKLGIK